MSTLFKGIILIFVCCFNLNAQTITTRYVYFIEDGEIKESAKIDNVYIIDAVSINWYMKGESVLYLVESIKKIGTKYIIECNTFGKHIRFIVDFDKGEVFNDGLLFTDDAK